MVTIGIGELGAAFYRTYTEKADAKSVRLFQRVNGVYYAVDLRTKHQTSLKTKVEDEAKRLIAAKNQAADTPQLNRAMAKVYASAVSPELMAG